jgi:hypothetical protein
VVDTLFAALVLLLCVVLGFRLGWVAREMHAKRILREMVEMVDDSEEENDETIAITIDKHNDQFFVYSLHDSTFMAQGSTRQEVEKHLEQQFPGKKFVATHQNLIDVGFAK